MSGFQATGVCRASCAGFLTSIPPSALHASPRALPGVGMTGSACTFEAARHGNHASSRIDVMFCNKSARAAVTHFGVVELDIPNHKALQVSLSLRSFSASKHPKPLPLCSLDRTDKTCRSPGGHTAAGLDLHSIAHLPWLGFPESQAPQILAHKMGSSRDLRGYCQPACL